MHTNSTLTQDTLLIKATESDLGINLSTDEFHLIAEKCNKVNITGRAKECKMELSEACNIDAVQLEIERFDAIMSSSQAFIRCNAQLNASLTNGSSLYYLGSCTTKVDATKDSQCIKMAKTTR
jgi:hypothetical protein